MTAKNTDKVETWKPVFGYEGLYEVSDFGRVKTVKRIINVNRIDRHFAVKKTLESKLLTQRIGVINGYLYCPLTKEGRQKNILSHRVVATSFLDNPNKLEMVNHKDGNKQNNKVDNLEWCSRAQNEAHAMAMGLKLKGSNIKRAILEERSIRAIKNMHNAGFTSSLIAELFEVSKAYVDAAIRNWKHASTSKINTIITDKPQTGIPISLIGIDGVEIKRYKSAASASIDLNVSIYSILRTARGGMKGKCKYDFTFLNTFKQQS